MSSEKCPEYLKMSGRWCQGFNDAQQSQNGPKCGKGKLIVFRIWVFLMIFEAFLR